jgi:hypothetical protein
MTGRRSRIRRRAAATAIAVASALCYATGALGLPPFTQTPKTSPPATTGQAEVFGLTVGCHATFDRLVVRTRLATPGYDVRYVPQIVADGSGLPVALSGHARLRVVIRPARGHNAAGTTSLLPAVVTPLCPNLRQLKTVGDFEGVVSFGLGLRHRTGFRVFRLAGPARIVIDVAR